MIGYPWIATEIYKMAFKGVVIVNPYKMILLGAIGGGKDYCADISVLRAWLCDFTAVDRAVKSTRKHRDIFERCHYVCI